jgi:hypothetical protein
VTTPVADQPQSPALAFTVGEPGEAGWRPLTVTGPPGADFTILDGGRVLVQGVLDGSGIATFAIRGSINGLTIAYSSTSVTAGGNGDSAAKSTGPDRRVVATD